MPTARSTTRFPSLDVRASCSLHQSMGVHCTPMDCEFYRVAPSRATIQRLKAASPVLSQNCPTPGCDGDVRYAAPGRGHRDGCQHPLLASVPVKRKGKGKR